MLPSKTWSCVFCPSNGGKQQTERSASDRREKPSSRGNPLPPLDVSPKKSNAFFANARVTCGETRFRRAIIAIGSQNGPPFTRPEPQIWLRTTIKPRFMNSTRVACRIDDSAAQQRERSRFVFMKPNERIGVGGDSEILNDVLPGPRRKVGTIFWEFSDSRCNHKVAIREAPEGLPRSVDGRGSLERLDRHFGRGGWKYFEDSKRLSDITNHSNLMNTFGLAAPPSRRDGYQPFRAGRTRGKGSWIGTGESRLAIVRSSRSFRSFGEKAGAILGLCYLRWYS